MVFDDFAFPNTKQDGYTDFVAEVPILIFFAKTFCAGNVEGSIMIGLLR